MSSYVPPPPVIDQGVETFHNAFVEMLVGKTTKKGQNLDKAKMRVAYEAAVSAFYVHASLILTAFYASHLSMVSLPRSHITWTPRRTTLSSPR